MRFGMVTLICFLLVYVGFDKDKHPVNQNKDLYNKQTQKLGRITKKKSRKGIL